MKTEQLIDSLCADARPTSGLSPRSMAVMWAFASTLAVLVFVGLALGMRPDLGAPLFSVASLAALGLLASAGYFAFATAVPARAVSGLARALPVGFLFAFLLALFFESIPPGDSFAAGLAVAGTRCSLCVIALGLLPGLAALFALRRLAPTELAATAGAWGMAMAAVGALGICFHCPAHNAVHLVVYHAVPVVALALTARFVGARLLRW